MILQNKVYLLGWDTDVSNSLLMFALFECVGWVERLHSVHFFHSMINGERTLHGILQRTANLLGECMLKVYCSVLFSHIAVYVAIVICNDE